MRYRAASPEALLTCELDAFVALFHRPSGATHLIASPAPEILATLGGDALDRDALLARLAQQFDLGDASGEALDARLAELVEAGLVETL